ncbi:exodeoxyribonuclease VII large subunit, partial [Candidatus Phytoplasma sp. AldY-WA1]|uniref:exodeoxyribonuclease VII large subunit n=1 Tax=Candidatus Phytoplasma sp. AldY-WA1 TaxID=2852100 RepID=UPI00254CCB07
MLKKHLHFFITLRPAIKKSKIPIVTAIGHAFNTAFSDLVAYDNAITPTSGIQKVLELIKFFDKAKNNYENHNDKLLDLYLGKIIDYSFKKQNDLIQQKESLSQQKAELIKFQNTLTQKEEDLLTETQNYFIIRNRTVKNSKRNS